MSDTAGLSHNISEGLGPERRLAGYRRKAWCRVISHVMTEPQAGGSLSRNALQEKNVEFQSTTVLLHVALRARLGHT